jgi:sugar phosphate permease
MFPILGIILWGVQRSTSQILCVAFISDIVPGKILGTAIGLYNVLTSITAIAANHIFATIAQSVNFHSGYLASSLLSLVALVAVFIFCKLKGRFTGSFATEP